MRHRFAICGLMTAAVVGTTVVGFAPSSHDGFTAEFDIRGMDRLVASAGNAYFPLNPGSYLRLEGEDDGQQVTVEITVLSTTRQVRLATGPEVIRARTRIVEERHWINGELTEVSQLYLACCPTTGNVYWFGERATHYDAGAVVSHEGSWVAGKKGAKPGLMMPGSFLLGSRYYQAQAPDVTMDRAENVGMGQTISTPAGEFHDCVIVRETSLMEPDEEVLKVYAPGIGLVVDGNLELVEFQP